MKNILVVVFFVMVIGVGLTYIWLGQEINNPTASKNDIDVPIPQNENLEGNIELQIMTLDGKQNQTVEMIV